MNTKEEGYISIKTSEYVTLLSDQRLLNCLRNAGVDNWDGWDSALEEFHGEEE
jgi:hypothetical protein